jgi:hypoxanthine phosphoribosyltransferase
VSTTSTNAALEVLFSHDQIARRVAEMGREIDRDYVGEKIVLVGVLKGAAIFLADLARSISVDNTFDFVAVSSYGKGSRTSGAVKLIKDLDNSIEGKNVIIVEDILDTGLTLNFLRGMFQPCLTNLRGAWKKSMPIMWDSLFPINLLLGMGWISRSATGTCRTFV